ncbi:MAG TPA: ABC transporter substrate-binding protein [Candidatus Binatia bacterium]|jgi:NitT/TauT family transport system substrate-binding protein
MWQTILTSLFCLVLSIDRAAAQPVRGAFPSPSIQILPLMVATERGFFKREGLDLELIFVRGASTAVQALLANQIHFIFSIGPQMPAVWEGNDIMLLAQQVGRPTFSLVVTPDIQKIADLKGKKLGVTFGGSTAAGTKALLELNKINPDKDVEYISLPGNEPKIAALKQGIIAGALLAPPADYLAMKSGMKRLVSLADVFKDTAFTGLAATSRTIKENPQMVKRMVRAIVRAVIHTRDNSEDALLVSMKRLGLDRDAAQDAYQMIREALVPVPTEKGVELMAQWQAIALNMKPKRKPSEYMDLRFANEVMAELGQK